MSCINFERNFNNMFTSEKFNNQKIDNLSFSRFVVSNNTLMCNDCKEVKLFTGVIVHDSIKDVNYFLNEKCFRSYNFFNFFNKVSLIYRNLKTIKENNEADRTKLTNEFIEQNNIVSSSSGLSNAEINLLVLENLEYKDSRELKKRDSKKLKKRRDFARIENNNIVSKKQKSCLEAPSILPRLTDVQQHRVQQHRVLMDDLIARYGQGPTQPIRPLNEEEIKVLSLRGGSINPSVEMQSGFVIPSYYKNHSTT
ncbi:MAG: hypothetical protein V4494_05935 [Chlamydiota bacterium]